MLPKLVITDIDGVWTDGGMYYTAEGDVMKRFSVKDGWGVIFLRELDIPVAIMTGENTQIVQKRADKLKIDYCYLGVKDKVAQAEELCRELGISLSEVAFIGDDLNDLPLLRLVGYSASPSNTPEYVKREVKYVTAAHGGYGAFREFVEKLLSDNGVLEKTVGMGRFRRTCQICGNGITLETAALPRFIMPLTNPASLCVADCGRGNSIRFTSSIVHCG